MKIIIVDDHLLIRAGLKEQLSQWFESAQVLEASSGNDALEQLRINSGVELAMVDLFMPDGDGFKFIRTLCDLFPDLPVLVLSSSQSPSDIRKSLDMGASGYVTKSSSGQEIQQAINKVLAGGVYVPVSARAKQLTTDAANSLELVKARLTERQLEVLVLMADGLSNKEIARHCDLSYNTVKVHVSAILRALGVDNRVRATILAQNLGLESLTQRAQ